jgi:ABC-type glycerol-3-phosphate transport system substrate-binding protein
MPTTTSTTKPGRRHGRLALALAIALGLGAAAYGTSAGAADGTSTTVPGSSTDHDSRITEATAGTGNQDGHGTRAGHRP